MDTKIPTEPGIYLFYGMHGRDTHMLPVGLEKIQVFLNSSGTLMYVGDDFIDIKSEIFIGVWRPLSPLIEEMKGPAENLVLNHLATTITPTLFRHSWSGLLSRNEILRQIREGRRLGPGPVSPEAVFDRAVQMGILVPDPKVKECWRLREESGTP